MTDYLFQARPSSLSAGDTLLVDDDRLTVGRRGDGSWSSYRGQTYVVLHRADPEKYPCGETRFPSRSWVTVDEATYRRVMADASRWIANRPWISERASMLIPGRIAIPGQTWASDVDQAAAELAAASTETRDQVARELGDAVCIGSWRAQADLDDAETWAATIDLLADWCSAGDQAEQERFVAIATGQADARRVEVPWA